MTSEVEHVKIYSKLGRVLWDYYSVFWACVSVTQFIVRLFNILLMACLIHFVFGSSIITLLPFYGICG